MTPRTPSLRVTAPLRIVVAEQDDDMREAVADELRRDGHLVAEVADGARLLSLLAQELDEEPGDIADVLVSDVKMPQVDGLDIVRALRGLGWLRPVVMLTNHETAAMSAEARRLGVVMVEKPLDMVVLREVVRLFNRPTNDRPN